MLRRAVRVCRGKANTAAGRRTTVLSIVRLPIGDTFQTYRGLADGSKFSEAELKTAKAAHLDALRRVFATDGIQVIVGNGDDTYESLNSTTATTQNGGGISIFYINICA